MFQNLRMGIPTKLSVGQKKTIFRCVSSLNAKQKVENDEEEFRVLNLKQKKIESNLRRKPRPVGPLPPRTNQMPVDQNWANVWPGPKTFHPASVPLPIRQGYTKKKDAPPSKYGNAELMKIPNFLHLTPPAIRQHCEALKKFCTAWPENLDTDEKCQEYFPLKIISSDYCHSSPSIRDPLARIVSIKIKLSDLPLNAHASDKFKRLVGERYNEETDDLIIVADRCPTKKQNYDYAMYLLTALFHESWTYEDWEQDKSEEDMEYYDFNTSKAKDTVALISKWTPENRQIDTSQVDVDSIPHVDEYKEVVVQLRNQGENDDVYEKYAQSTKKLLNLM